jgi:hypothetical protein
MSAAAAAQQEQSAKFCVVLVLQLVVGIVLVTGIRNRCMTVSFMSAR